MTTVPVPQPAPRSGGPDPRSVCVVIPMPADPPWGLFDEVPGDVPIIVCDDSGGRLTPPPRSNVWVLDDEIQRAYAGRHRAAMPRRSAASRNIGHYVAHREGFDVIVALDYDCRTRPGWLERHLGALTKALDAPARRPRAAGGWVNSVDRHDAAGRTVYARGYPYELRTPELDTTDDATATGEVLLNMGVWDGVCDLNGVDKLASGEPGTPGIDDDTRLVALGDLPLCGMNTAFAAELTPAYYFLPDVTVNGWPLSRHDDIWGGYVVQQLMALRGDLVSFGGPVVEHTRQTPLERVVVLEQWMHLLSMPFYEIVDAAVADVPAGDYATMYAHFVDEYRRLVAAGGRPPHYSAVFRELGEWMARWVEAFS